MKRLIGCMAIGTVTQRLHCDTKNANIWSNGHYPRSALYASQATYASCAALTPIVELVPIASFLSLNRISATVSASFHDESWFPPRVPTSKPSE
jgi:hypothetical protein